jgi:hypothetical protein
MGILQALVAGIRGVTIEVVGGSGSPTPVLALVGR